MTAKIFHFLNLFLSFVVLLVRLEQVLLSTVLGCCSNEINILLNEEHELDGKHKLVI